MIAEILCVGTELLLGDILNTNAQYLSRRLADCGFNVYRQTVVGDNASRLEKAIAYAFEVADIVITSGGLGPTEDDLTKEVAAAYFHQDLVFDHESWQKIEQRFSARKLPIPESNRKQALFPKGAIILDNPNGTAPGAIFGNENKKIILLPGPPFEMKPMFENHVLPFLVSKQENSIVSRVFRTAEIGESALEEILKPLIHAQSNPTLATYASDNEVTVRVTARAKNRDEALSLLNAEETQLRKVLGDFLYGIDGQSLASIVMNQLIEKNWSLCVVDAFTGGVFYSLLSQVEGACSLLKKSFLFCDEAEFHQWAKALGTVSADISATPTVPTGSPANAIAKKIYDRENVSLALTIHRTSEREVQWSAFSPTASFECSHTVSGEIAAARLRFVKQMFNRLRLWLKGLQGA